jgi:hypothetical protein
MAKAKKSDKLTTEQLFSVVQEYSKPNDIKGLVEKTGSTKDAILNRIIPG